MYAVAHNLPSSLSAEKPKGGEGAEERPLSSGSSSAPPPPADWLTRRPSGTLVVAQPSGDDGQQGKRMIFRVTLPNQHK